MSDSTKVFTADQDDERLDRFLTRMEPALSRAHVQKVIAEGQALVGGRVRKSNYKLQAGEEVIFHLPEAKPVEILPEDIPLAILYEDSDIIVVNKARGMVVHPATGIYTGTLVNALLYHCKDLSGINGEIRPGIVHRLDKDTSGVMVAAKNDAAHLDLAEQIRTKAAHRIYWAIVCGNIREEAGVIKGDIGRHPTDRKKMAIVHEHGKPAVTSACSSASATTRSSSAAWRRAARTRSACTWRASGIPCSAIPSTGRARPARLPSRGRRCIPCNSR